MSRTKSFFKGVAYIAISKYSNILVGLVVTAVLSRILQPGDFGVVAIATVFITFFYMLSDLGIGPAIIQYRNLSEEDISSLFGWSFWLSIMLGGLFFLISPFISILYELGILNNICKLLSIQVLFTTLNIIPNAILMRQKKFGTVAIRNFVINVMCGVISIIAAVNGLGIYSLLINPLLGSFAIFFINIYYKPIKIKLIPSISPVKCIFNFSLYQFLFNFVNYFGRNFDKLLIGKILPVSELGYYEKSYRLMMMPIGNINGVISPVLHPFLSDNQNDLQQILFIYNRMNRILATIAFIISSICVACSREIVLLIFGNQWYPAIPYFLILSISIAPQITSVTSGAVLQACNRTKLMFKLGTIDVVVAISGLLIAATIWGSVVSISIAFVLTSLFSSCFSLYVVYRFCFQTTSYSFFKFCLKPLSFFFTYSFLWYIIGFDIVNNLLVSLFIKILVWLVFSYIYLQCFSDYKPNYYLSKYFKTYKKKEIN